VKGEPQETIFYIGLGHTTPRLPYKRVAQRHLRSPVLTCTLLDRFDLGYDVSSLGAFSTKVRLAHLD